MRITPQQFKQMEQRLAKPRRTTAPVFEAVAARPTRAPVVILGIDPSLRGTGYGVIRLARPVPETLAHGTISCPSGWERSRCLVKIVQTLREVLKAHSPSVCVVEGLFYAQNLQTAQIMGEARGARSSRPSSVTAGRRSWRSPRWSSGCCACPSRPLPMLPTPSPWPWPTPRKPTVTP